MHLFDNIWARDLIGWGRILARKKILAPAERCQVTVIKKNSVLY